MSVMIPSSVIVANQKLMRYLRVHLQPFHRHRTSDGSEYVFSASAVVTGSVARIMRANWMSENITVVCSLFKGFECSPGAFV